MLQQDPRFRKRSKRIFTQIAVGEIANTTVSQIAVRFNALTVVNMHTEAPGIFHENMGPVAKRKLIAADFYLFRLNRTLIHGQ